MAVSAKHPLAFSERVGAALASPRLAMRHSDSPRGVGRASSDIAILLVLALLAVETRLLASCGWMIIDGDIRGALMMFMVGARDHLAMPILILLGGSALMSIAAGKKRHLSNDFDLACVALTPLVFVELVHTLLGFAGLFFHRPAQVVGYTWFVGLLVVAWQQARSR